MVFTCFLLVYRVYFFHVFTFFWGIWAATRIFPRWTPQRQKEFWEFCLGVIQTLVSWETVIPCSEPPRLHGKPSQPWQLGRLSALIDSWRVLPRWRVLPLCKTHQIWCMLVKLVHVGAILFPALPVLPVLPLVFDCFSQSFHAQLSKLLLCSFYLRRISDLNQSQMALALSSGLLWRILELHLPCTIFCFVDPRDSSEEWLRIVQKWRWSEIAPFHCGIVCLRCGCRGQEKGL